MSYIIKKVHCWNSVKKTTTKKINHICTNPQYFFSRIVLLCKLCVCVPLLKDVVVSTPPATVRSSYQEHYTQVPLSFYRLWNVFRYDQNTSAHKYNQTWNIVHVIYAHTRMQEKVGKDREGSKYDLAARCPRRNKALLLRIAEESRSEQVTNKTQQLTATYKSAECVFVFFVRV